MPDESHLNRAKHRQDEFGPIERRPDWDEATESTFIYRADSSMAADFTELVWIDR